ncbi:hypothetical protein HK104_001064 [Borealophlyctis nickersoniae]|nr:hypothetical protein HK104_001064 [Borealophlyctis nickersoniae]
MANGSRKGRRRGKSATTSGSPPAGSLMGTGGPSVDKDGDQPVGAEAPSTPMNFLKASFPEIPTARLEIILERCDQDVEKAVNIILAESEDDCGSSGASDTSADDSSESSHGDCGCDRDLFFPMGITDPKLKTLHEIAPSLPLLRLQNILEDAKGDLDNAVEMVLSALEGRSPLSTGTPTPHRRRVTDPSYSFALDSPFEKQITDLQSMFPDHAYVTIQSALSTHKGNTERAVETLLRLSTETIASRTNESDQDVATLTEIFPDRSTDDILAALRDSDLETAVAKLSITRPSWKPESINWVAPKNEMGMGSRPARSMLVPSGLSEESFSVALGRSRKTHQPGYLPSNLDQSDAKPVSPVIKHGVSASPYDYDYGDPVDLRNQAQALRKERENAFRKAATAFRKGDLTGKGSAAYYSEVGRDFTLQMERWNKQAAQALIERNKARQGNDPNVLDLHGLTVPEALEYVEGAVNDWYSRDGASTSPRAPLKIIAGAGMHSKGIRKLYPAVYKQLSRKGWKLTPGGNGWFFVRGV